MRRCIALLLTCYCCISFGQQPEESGKAQTFEAIIVNAQTDLPLESVHVINLNKVVGRATFMLSWGRGLRWISGGTPTH